MKAFSWVETDDLASALAAGAQPGALYKAGGVDLADRLKEHLDEPETLVNLRRIKALEFVRDDGSGGLRLGPLVTLALLADDARIRRSAPALADAAAAAATPQIRNLATLGGNLAQRPRCWYFRREEFKCRKKGGKECFALEGRNEEHAVFENDQCAMVHPSGTATVLSGLGGSLVLKSAQSDRTVGVDDFFIAPKVDLLRENMLQPGELIVEVRVPGGRRSGYVKLMEKQSFDWPMAEAAVSFKLVNGEINDARISLGAAAPRPWRATAAEKLIEGKKLIPELAAQAGRAAVQGARPLANNGYKLALLETAVRRALLLAGG